MKILLIDNLSIHVPKIVACLFGHEIHTVRYDNIPSTVEEFDAIILSGGGILGAQKNRTTAFADEIKLIQTTNKPLLGICLGFQLLTLAYDGSLIQGEKNKGWEEVEIKQPFLIPKGNYSFFQVHRWKVQDSGTLEIIAENEEHIQVLQHSSKPHYGTIFHPELSEQEGQDLLQAFLEQAKKYGA